MSDRVPKIDATLAAVLVAGAWLRLAWNDVTLFSPADEAQYLDVTRRLVARGYFAGYADAARDYLASPERWTLPTLLRTGHFATTTLACRAAGECTFATLAWVSTLAGIAALVFAWMIARDLLDRPAALAGAALVAASPLQLGLSRRALQDEVACAASLAAVAAFVAYLRAPRGRELARGALFVAAATFALLEKESFALYAPALVALGIARHADRGWRRPDVAIAALPIALYLAITVALLGGASAFVAMLRALRAGVTQTYALQYQSGPPHRVLLDLAALAPLVVILAIGAAYALVVERPARPESRGPRELALLAATSALAFALVSKNLRFLPGVDALVTLVAGYGLARLAHLAQDRSRANVLLAAFTAAIACIGLSTFHRVFVARAVYDPTTDAVMRALDMAPH